MKTYVITLAKMFPKWHPERGRETNFKNKVLYALKCPGCKYKQELSGEGETECDRCFVPITYDRGKFHTIRTNVSLWQKRMKEIEAGKASLSIREWSGRPYLSRQVEIARLTRENGVGMQRLDGCDVWGGDEVCKVYDAKGVRPVRAEELALNDGLRLEDWQAWFGRSDADSDLAIIHFTPFRY